MIIIALHIKWWLTTNHYGPLLGDCLTSIILLTIRLYCQVVNGDCIRDYYSEFGTFVGINDPIAWLSTWEDITRGSIHEPGQEGHQKGRAKGGPRRGGNAWPWDSSDPGGQIIVVSMSLGNKSGDGRWLGRGQGIFVPNGNNWIHVWGDIKQATRWLQFVESQPDMSRCMFVNSLVECKSQSYSIGSF